MSKIIIVDDSQTALIYIKNELILMGIDKNRILCEENPNKAFNYLKNSTCDNILISDIIMAPMNGFTLVAKVRQDSRLAKTPIFLISASDSREVRKKADSFDILSFIKLPIEDKLAFKRQVKKIYKEIIKCN